ncbi:alpha/beta hydrolase fold protein [Segniliparus rotundus DSM 44985]|uniref:Alpha/beta hydrolase fold protein n=1 Tax=Segniliparus rotundus (strain ATCC BAA-972 / CDC 1076 / CIP 108378 / DSM 44985 / JCM 13578) TaxID=640132 RepID=D6ZD76_SEGRD|nr:alpha/beta hydrolase [Segniliparus rotundus]ADG97140.1 alpha/beta hydrolase fold protein [Segniliparus rotundus DSM 44985]
MSSLHTHLFGPADGPPILAIHGVTGYGGRFRRWSQTQVPHARVIAPDLLGHGHSSWTAPWNIEAQVDALEATAREHANGPVLVLAHSYGGLLSVHLANQAPDLVKGLLLLDPAIGARREQLTEYADWFVEHHSYRDRDEAFADKKSEAWADVPDEILQAELDEHFVELPDGRFFWRFSPAALITSWSELARPWALPPAGITATVLVADKVQPPYFNPEYEQALRERLGDALTVAHLDVNHMVLEERPEVVGELARELL